MGADWFAKRAKSNSRLRPDGAWDRRGEASAARKCAVPQAKLPAGFRPLVEHASFLTLLAALAVAGTRSARRGAARSQSPAPRRVRERRNRARRASGPR